MLLSNSLRNVPIPNVLSGEARAEVQSLTSSASHDVMKEVEYVFTMTQRGYVWTPILKKSLCFRYKTAKVLESLCFVFMI